MKILSLIILLFLSGCALTPQNNPQAIYNISLQHINKTVPIKKQSGYRKSEILTVDAIAPAWLDTQTIQYRMTYHDPLQIYSYANSRWAASPGTMLELYISNRILAETIYTVARPGTSTKADYDLLLELNEFSQVFDDSNSSHVIVSLNASLINRKTRKITAQQHFDVQTKTLTTDAAGAAKALNKASDELTDNLIAWLETNITNRD